MDVVMRRADDRDCQSIARFVRATLQVMESSGGHDVNPDEGFWQRYGEKLVELNREDHRLFLIAQADSRVLGCLCGKVSKLHEAFVSKKIFHIDVVYVIPESRKRGVATSLVQEALKWASGEGCQESNLNVIIDNDKARELYKRLGFRAFRHEMRLTIPTFAKAIDGERQDGHREPEDGGVDLRSLDEAES